MKTLTVSDYTYELHVLYDEKHVTFFVYHIELRYNVMEHSLRRSLAEKITVQHAIKDYLTNQLSIVDNLHDSTNVGECNWPGRFKLSTQASVLHSALGLVELAIAHYDEE
jgi:hypothetical protein